MISIFKCCPLKTFSAWKSLKFGIWERVKIKGSCYDFYFQMLFQENKIKGRQADVMIAAYNAAEVALRLVKPGNEVSGDPTSVHLVSKRSWVQSPAATDESPLKKKNGCSGFPHWHPGLWE